MKKVWLGIVIMVVGIVGEGILFVKQGGGDSDTMSVFSWIILLGGILVLWSSLGLKKAGSTMPAIFAYLMAICSASLIIGWLWDTVLYHWMALDDTLQFLAHGFYDLGSILLLLVAIVGSIVQVIRRKSNTTVLPR